MKRRLVLAIGISCTACLMAMDGDNGDRCAKRQRAENKADDTCLLLMSKGMRYELEKLEQKEFETLVARMEKEIRDSALFDCFICTHRFSRTRRIVLLPCGKHYVCEECAIKLLCPSTQQHAPVKQCPACRETPSNPMAARTLFKIAHQQVTEDGKLLSLRQAQELFMDKPDKEEDGLTADAVAAALGENAALGGNNETPDVVEVPGPDGVPTRVVFDPDMPPILRTLILAQLHRTGELPPEPPF